MKKFEVGKVYFVYTMAGDKKFVTIISRTKNTVTYNYNGNKSNYNTNIFINSVNGDEAFNTRYKQTVLSNDLMLPAKSNVTENMENIANKLFK